MITHIERPVMHHPPLELRVTYVVIRSDGHSKKFDAIGSKDGGPWTFGNHYPTPGEVLIPIDPWTAVKAHMVTFEELQLPEGARALVNIIK